jgi:hypothetical protein
MWALNNKTPYAADRTWVRDKTGKHHWIVVAKATFEFDAQGKLSLADQQLPPLHEPAYFGEPGRSSLRYEADLIAMKPNTDVTLNAHAHAPGHRASREVVVALRIANLEKQLLVRGASTHTFGVGGLAVSNSEPFITRPITYELAYGGTDTVDEDPSNHRIDLRNPVGVGFAARSEHLIGRTAPSIYYPRGAPAKLGPAGFGALASYWSPRLERGGTYDDNWAAHKRPLLPDDYDETQLLCAPADQWPRQRMRGGEIIDLINLTPEGALRFELPKICVMCTTRISGHSPIEYRCELASVVIEPEVRTLIMVWQGSLHVSGTNVDYLDESRVWEKPYLW